MSLESEIRELVRSVGGYDGDPAELTADYPLLERDVLDSQAIFALIEEIEASYRVDIDDLEIVPENFETIRAIVQLVEPKVE